MIKPIICFSAVVIFCSCYNCEESNRGLTDKKLTCLLDTIYKRKEARYVLTAKLNCEESNNGFLFLDKYEYPTLLENGEAGDMIVKDSNSLLFKLIKRDGTIIDFYPICDGKQIK